MIQLLAIINALIFAFLSGIHIYWGLGGKWASQNVLPQKPNEADKPVIMPGFIASFIVALGLATMAIVTLQTTHIVHFLNMPSFIEKYGLYTISIIFLIRALGDFNYVGLFKKIKNTGFGRMDTLYYTPLCAFLGITSLLIKFFA